MIIKEPKTPYQWSKQFIQGMIDRMGVSYYKYGDVKLAYPHKVDAMASLKKRLDKYDKTGNTEWLIDAANFAMIEFMYPKHSEAHFEPTDSNQSIGRKWIGEVDSTARANTEF